MRMVHDLRGDSESSRFLSDTANTPWARQRRNVHNRYYRRNALWHSIIHGCVLKQLPELPTGCVSRTSSVQCRPGSVTAVITSVDSVRQDRAGRGMGLRPPTMHPPGTNDARQRSSEISGVLYWGARHVPRRPHYIYCGPVALFRHCDELRMSTTATDCATR